MSVLHQMGHDTDNLLDDACLAGYRGAIVSPVNYSESKLVNRVVPRAQRGGLELVFDPQLYYPRSERGSLREWDYFPDDLDSGDLSSITWWTSIVDALVGTLDRIRPQRACSPAAVPGAFPDDYFATCVRVGTVFAGAVRPLGITPLQTVIVPMAELATASRALEIASIVSQTACDGVYLVFVGGPPPQQERSDVEDLKGGLRLIAALAGAGVRTLVAFCSSDVLLFKSAGASECATGKFYNLRRFTPSRFDDPSEGGGQLANWFEEDLLAFLRESDLLRVQRAGIESDSSRRNPFRDEILACAAEGRAWVGLGWRQYMAWFADIEGRISSGAADVAAILRRADSQWRGLDDREILMESRRNDGSWIRSWRRALIEYRAD